jgi:hypothetical protein
MSGLDTSQSITDEASQHAEELHLASRPHADISGQSPLPHATEAQPETETETQPETEIESAADEAPSA